MEKARINVQHWKGLCLRGFDYSEVRLFQVDKLESFEDETEEDDQEMADMRLKRVLL